MRLLLLLTLVTLTALASAFETAWFRTYNGPGNGMDQAFQVRIDGSSNSYYLGQSASAAGNTSVALVKYNKAGVFQWAHRLEASGESYEDPYLAQDGQGNFYIACTRRINAGSGRSIFLRKVTSENAIVWSREFITANHIQDFARGLTLDAAGNTYILTEPVEQYPISGGSATTRNIAITSYNASGTHRWVDVFKGFDADFNPQEDFARSIRLDSLNNVLVAGESDLFGSIETDVVILKTSSGGARQWTRLYQGLGGFFDGAATSIAPDNSNNVLVCGWVRFDQFDDFDMLTLKYSAGGTFTWSRNFDGPLGNTDKAFKVTTDANNNVLVAGQAVMIAGRGTDAIVMKYGPNGEIFQPFSYSGGTGSNEEVFLDVFVDGRGTIHAGGAMGFESETRLFAGWCRFFVGGGLGFGVHAYASIGDAICYDLGMGPNGDIYLAGRAADDMLAVREVQEPIAVANTYNAVQNSVLTIADPGVILNDFFTEGSTTSLVTNVAHGTLTLNAAGGFVYTPTGGFTGTDTFSYKLIKQGPTIQMTSNTVTVTLNVSTMLQSLTISPNSVPGGVKPTATVTLGLPAPAGGATIPLGTTNGSVASVPANLFIPAGLSSGTFQITTVPPATDTNATISATYQGTTKTATLTVKPIDLVSFLLQPASVNGGESSIGIVVLSYPAPAGGRVITLSDNSTSISEPSTVTVPGGARTANFPITTAKIGVTAIRELYATLNTKRTARITLYPTPRLTAFTLSPTTVKGGNDSTGTVTISIAAGAQVKVALTDNSSAITIPSSVTVAVGATQATFTASTSPVSSTATRSITASYQGVARTALLTITP